MGFIPDNIFIHIAIVVVCFYILAKAADQLVEGAVGVAYSLNIPKIIVGIVLVGFMTTAPEFTVSMISAAQGAPEIALGNAVGSVIVDDALALALGIIVAPVAIAVDSRVLRTTGLFLIAIDLVAFLLSLDGTVGRGEGIVLLILLAGYLATVVIVEMRRRRARRADDESMEADEFYKPATLGRQLRRFVVGIVGVLVASEFLVNSAQFIARFLGIPPVVIGLTLVAIGTSIPEIATSIIAARKGHGDLAFGDILGADILNILWIVGASATVNPLSVGRKVTLFSFPAMIVVVGTMLLFARMGHRFQRWKGIVLIIMYLVYLTVTIVLFYS
ncbi:MAG TPA: calcium/sodium antiporter [Spirochaetia bacterium]|nr:calcium/sodium antiporter [Spirochaetia bacterium]